MTMVDQTFVRSSNMNNVILDFGKYFLFHFSFRKFLRKLQFGLATLKCSPPTSGLAWLLYKHAMF